MSGAGGSYSRLGLHVGSDWWAVCHTYGDRAPILSVDAGGSGVAVCISDQDSTRAVEFARALLREVQAFAEETERFYGGQATSGTTGEAA